MDYAEIQETLQRHLRLLYYPVAVKFIFTEDELEKFRETAEYVIPAHPLTFCQCVCAARQKGLTILGTREKLGCSNARYVFGWKNIDEREINAHLKYTRDRGQAERFIKTKPRLLEGKLKAFVVSSLGKAPMEPDVVHIICDNLQAHQLAVSYMTAFDKHPLQFNYTVNSAVCGGVVWVYLNRTMNIIPMCSGSYTSGKTERGETNVTIPGDHIEGTTKRLLDVVGEYGESLYPGMDVCKNCNLIRFVKPEK